MFGLLIARYLRLEASASTVAAHKDKERNNDMNQPQIEEQTILSELSSIYVLEGQLGALLPKLQYEDDFGFRASFAHRLSQLQSKLDQFEAMLNGVDTFSLQHDQQSLAS
jgi:hypothetical protein